MREAATSPIELARLETLDLSAMRQEWRRLYRAEPPRLSSRSHDAGARISHSGDRLRRAVEGDLAAADEFSPPSSRAWAIATPAQPRIKPGSAPYPRMARTNPRCRCHRGWFRVRGETLSIADRHCPGDHRRGLVRTAVLRTRQGCQFLQKKGCAARQVRLGRRARGGPVTMRGGVGCVGCDRRALRRLSRRPRRGGPLGVHCASRLGRRSRISPAVGNPLRCYTRKSSEEGLEQEFNSLDAQREACEAFVRSQKHEGWSVLPQLYDDPGYSGGTMERPELKRPSRRSSMANSPSTSPLVS